MNKKIFNKKAGISYLEISIMIISVFAFSYIVYSSTTSVDAAQNNGLPTPEELSPAGRTSPQAQGLALMCCEETLDGHSCQNLADTRLCNSSLKIAPTECDTTNFCEIGCCQSKTNGLCNKQTSKRDCTKTGGNYINNPLCATASCKQGCCMIGDEAIWTTQSNCKFEGNTRNKDLVTNWIFDEDHNSELKCIFSTQKEKEGACVYQSGDERKCIFTTFLDCIERTGDEKSFNQNGTFCSDQSLNTTCKAKDHKGCLENKEDVYWFDSCGNHESVASDCNFASGTYCGKEEQGDYYCKDINCVVDRVSRLNGESWCEYDLPIGNGKDRVGSRHVKHICYMGTERIEPCADFRNEICVQLDGNVKNGKSISQANCRVNNWRMCLSYNSKKGSDAMVNQCNANPDCRTKEIDMNGGFHFKVCLPAYPPGFNLAEEYTVQNGVEVPDSSESICSMATQRCTETWVCGIFGCVCVDSCGCHTAKFTQDMNDFCTSLGDCGAKANYIGVWTDGGYSVKSTGAAPPRLSKPSNTGGYTGQHTTTSPAKPGNMEFFETLTPVGLTEITGTSEKFPSNMTSFEQQLLSVSGAYGSPYLFKMLSKNESDSSFVSNPNLNAVSVGSYYNGYASIQSSISSQIVYKEKKAGGFEMLGAMIAALIAFIITQSIIIALLAAMLAFLFLIAWIKYVQIDFTCNKWERPSGGKDCNVCNKVEVPCTEYRCQSLGQSCMFINKGTPSELCVTRPANLTVPKISPLTEYITIGYKYANINERGFEIQKSDGNGCVDAYTTVRFGISVDPFAKCRFGTDQKQAYEEMPEKFGIKGDSVLPVHRMDFYFPSLQSLQKCYNLTDNQIKQVENLKFYVKCKTADGTVNLDPFTIKTCINPAEDLTPPLIGLTEPMNKGFAKYGAIEQNLTIYVNEPANCKWSVTENKPYDQMENTMKCKNDCMDLGMFGFPCNTMLTGLNNNTKFYIKCRDTSKASNTMATDYLYQIAVSESPLLIDEIIPANNEDIVGGSQPFLVTLKAATSGGAQSGVSTCKWEQQGGNGYGDYFTETNSTTHSGELSAVLSGKYNIKIICEDIAGNVAENSTTFRLIIDNYGPQIVRVYSEGGLKIVTDENGECRYDFKKRFDFENATLMGGSGNSYYGDWQDKIYYIQCKDEFSNTGGSITVRPYQVFAK